jgi:hypothetical protein
VRRNRRREYSKIDILKDEHEIKTITWEMCVLLWSSLIQLESAMN